MSTTDHWRELDRAGMIQVHDSNQWVMICTHQNDNGWYLFGPATAGVRVDPGEDSPALNLLLASRAADAYIAPWLAHVIEGASVAPEN